MLSDYNIQKDDTLKLVMRQTPFKDIVCKIRANRDLHQCSDKMWSKIHAQWSSSSDFKSHVRAQAQEHLAGCIEEFTGQATGDVVYEESDS
eukprot:1720945-Heterocapsa_arctica.AAC.1